MPALINPLRYPGAKRTLSNYVESLLVFNKLEGCTFFEPYAGSAVVGYELLSKKVINKLIISEIDILIFSFWECVFKHTEELCRLITDTPITIETWQKLKHLRNIANLDQYSIIEIGFAGLFFNRTNFSGILNANPIGGINQSSRYSIDCRFNKKRIIEIIYKTANFCDKVEVHWSDAIDFIKAHESSFATGPCFAYFDPPYYNNGAKIYRHFYKNNDHIKLAKFITNLTQLDWLISYDESPFICGLYSNTGTKYRSFFLDYSCASKVRTKGRELLISNLPLPPVECKNVVNI